MVLSAVWVVLGIGVVVRVWEKVDGLGLGGKRWRKLMGFP